MRKKLDGSVWSAFVTLGVLLAAAVLLSMVTLFPRSGANVVAAGAGGDNNELAADDSAAAGDVAAANGGGTIAGGATTKKAGAAGSTAGGVGATSAAACSSAGNGGATDTGVTASSIKLAATVVDDGPGSSFLGPVRIGMKAVVDAVNRKGGVCGRQLALVLRNDSWDATRGQTFIQNFVESEKAFALAVVPSSEGLRAASNSGYIDARKIPVVGTDGMLIHQYKDPWIWPVATSTISTMHVIARNGWDRGARDFAIVFDAKYHFGVEGAYAFNAAVHRLTGADVPGYDPSLKSCVQRFCGIQPGKSSYGAEAKSFNDDCDFTYTASGKSRCGLVAVLLEPDTAASFLREPRQADALVGYSGAQPLFNRHFADVCGSFCKTMWVWTGYNPPVETLTGIPGVAAYVDAVHTESSTADVANQFLEGGYQGMSLLAEALRRTGPNLTRDRLRAVLDSITFDSGLSKPLSWTANHFANTSARGFGINYTDKFVGFAQRTEFLSDPWVGQDIPAGEGK